jgi:hypothetical protein
VYVDEAEAEPHATDLLLGQYRLWVEPTDPSAADPLRRAVTIGEPNETVVVRFPPGMATPAAVSTASEEPEPAADAAMDRGSSQPGRLLPRWAEVTGLVVGAVAAGAGATLIGIDGNCVRPDPCEDLFKTQEGGIATLAVGGAVMITAAVLLTIDEVRIRKKRAGGRAALSGPRLRF